MVNVQLVLSSKEVKSTFFYFLHEGGKQISSRDLLQFKQAHIFSDSLPQMCKNATYW